MAIARVQFAPFGTAAAASVTSTALGATPTPGNLLLAVGYGTNGIANAAMPAGWKLATSTLRSSTAGHGLWWKPCGIGEATTFQLTWTSSSTTGIYVVEWGGFTGMPVVDQVANLNSTGSTTTSQATGTTATTTAPEALCYATVGIANTVSAVSWNNSFTVDFSALTNALGASRVVSAAGTYTTTASWTTARIAGGLIATFRAQPYPVILAQAVNRAATF